jgi:hypothetical protein
MKKPLDWFLCEDCGHIGYGDDHRCKDSLSVPLDEEAPMTFQEMEALRHCADTGDWREASRLLMQRWNKGEKP